VRSLRDKQQFQDDEDVAKGLGINSTLWPIFGVVWDSAQILAHYMCDFDIIGKKTLEVGCGLGLASLMLNQRHADITCTDYHPEVQAFLDVNTNLNTGRDIPFILADWAVRSHSIERFDLIIGSDLLYEESHALLLSEFLERFAKAKCEIIIVDPGRGRLNKFTHLMQSLSFSFSQKKPKEHCYLASPFKGTINIYKRP
jgi:predicted nicotinamide N-methyase